MPFDEMFNNLKSFLQGGSSEIVIWSFLINLLVTVLFCWLLGLMYRHWGSSLSNRDSFARNFVVIGATTMMIIVIVKSSFALSLGLIGALSIVRFRTAIKEPEELAYLFLTIAIGLGFGAHQWQATSLSFLVITVILYVKHLRQSDEPQSNLYLTVKSDNPEEVTLTGITDALKDKCAGLALKRFDETKNEIEASYLINFQDIEQLNAAKTALQACGSSVRVSFVDNEGIL